MRAASTSHAPEAADAPSARARRTGWRIPIPRQHCRTCSPASHGGPRDHQPQAPGTRQHHPDTVNHMAKRAASPAAGTSQRQLRVGELIRHAVSQILARGEIQDEALSRSVVTVPEVRMSTDLKLATCYVMPLGGKDEAPVIAALERHKKYLRTEVAKRVNLRFAPELRFRRDETFDEAGRIDRLLQSDKVQADLIRPEEESDFDD